MEKWQLGGIRIRHDRAGNILNDGLKNYRYDVFNCLAEITTLSGNTIQISHDPLARPTLIHASDGPEEFMPGPI